MWKVGYCLFLSFLLGISTSAVSGGNVTAYMAHNVSPHSEGINVDYTLKRTDSAGQDWYKKAKVHYPKEKGAKRVLNARKRITPLEVGLALAAASAGWVIDELTNQVNTGQSGEIDPSAYIYSHFLLTDWYSTPDAACSHPSIGDHYVNVSGYQGYRYLSTSGGQCHYEVLLNGLWRPLSDSLKIQSCSSSSHPACITQASPVPINELWPALKDVLTSLPPDVLREIFETGGVPILTPELAAALAEYAAESGATTDATDPSNQNDESTADEENPEQKEEILPDDQQDLHQITVQQVEWNAGLGSGSCPQSKSVQGMFPINSEWGTICDAASNIFKPIFLLLCALGSAAIVAGQRLWG